MGFPTTGHFLSMTTHHLESLSRILSVPWDLHALMADFSPSTTGCIIDLQSNDFVKCLTTNHSFTLYILYWSTLRAIVIIGGFSHTC